MHPSPSAQIAFLPGPSGEVVGVSYSLWTGVAIRAKREWHGTYALSGGYTHTVYNMSLD